MTGVWMSGNPRKGGIVVGDSRSRASALLVALIGGVLGAGLVTGCSSDKAVSAGPKATMLAPGKPGEPNRTVTVGPGTPAAATAADIKYVQMMIPHHRQAVEMAVLAPKQARDTAVKALADRIDKGQGGEISAMQSWLRQHGATEGQGQSAGGGHTGHGRGTGGGSGATGGAGGTTHGNMPGMATPEQMARLQAAEGTEFDRMFLSLMITHHQGALTMAREVLAHGLDTVVNDMARDVLTSQNAEINRMRDMASGLG